MFLPLYIDPGTGSMLISLLIGITTVAIFGIRSLIVKIQFLLSGGKKKNFLISTKIPYVIFSDHKRYWNVFKPICDEFEKRKLQLVYYTASADDPAFTEKYNYIKTEFIGEGNNAFAKLNVLNAGIVMATTPHLDVYQWKRSKNVDCYVHIPHTVDDLSGYRMFGLDFYDVVLVSGSNQTEFIRKIEEKRPTIKKKELVEVGSLPLDNLKQKFESTSRVINNQKIVLLAPTWGKSGILTKYGEKFLNALKNTDYKIIIRPHPQTVVSEQDILKPLEEKFSCFEWNYDNDNFEVLNKSDILITDFSGIIFDYSLIFDKPLIYADTNLDIGVYDAAWLDEKYWSLRAVEKLGVKLNENKFSEINTVIAETLSNQSLRKNRELIRNECWYDIGNAKFNAVEFVLKRNRDIEKMKTL